MRFFSQSEIVWISLISSLSAFFIFYLLYHSTQFSSKSAELLRFYISDSALLESLGYLYIANFQPIKKSYLQMMIDSLLFLKNFEEKFLERHNIGDKVYYGIYLGTYNVSDIVYPFFNSIIGENRWQLVVFYNQNLYHIYGYNISEISRNIRSYILSIPIPDGEKGFIVLRVV